MGGMGLHRFESIVDERTLVLPTKLKDGARARLLIEKAAKTHPQIQNI